MEHSTHVHKLRKAFRSRLAIYFYESRQMRDLLSQLEDSPESERFEEIREQQARLDEAFKQYERARTAYVGHVLAEFMVTSAGVGTLLSPKVANRR